VSQVFDEISWKMHQFSLRISTMNRLAKHVENNIQNWSVFFAFSPLGPPPKKTSK